MEEEIPIKCINDIPEELRSALSSMGITKLRGFQVKALKLGLKGRNLVISAPTGSGKTLVGEILAFIRIRKEGAKVLFLVPYKALAEEIYNTLITRYPMLRIGISTGDYKETPSFQLGILYDLIVMTYEKADMLLRERPPWLSRVSLVITDEIHMLDDVERGSLLDALITRLKRLGIQLVALSATIKNAEDIAKWLDAELVKSDYRPVKLLEGVYLPPRGKIYFYDPNPEVEETAIIESRQQSPQTLLDFFNQSAMEEIAKALGGKVRIKGLSEKRLIEVRRNKNYDDLALSLASKFNVNSGEIFCEDVYQIRSKERGFLKYILDLTHDLLKKAMEIGTTWQILIFRRSRQLSQTTAERIAEMLEKTGLSKLFPEGKEIARRLLQEVDEVSPLTEALAEVLKRGVAFHHAGLTREERRFVEEAFRDRKIGVIVCTPTLGAGINLPARRVVVEHYVFDPLYGMGRISVSQYKQRGGRAGRPGLDTVGESILIARDEADLGNLFRIYVFGEPEPISSKLGGFLPELRKQLLAEAVFKKFEGLSEDDAIAFFSQTFYAWQATKSSDFLALYQMRENIKKGLEELLCWGYLYKRGRKYYPTRIGEKISLLYLDPLSGRVLLDLLERLKKSGKSEANPAIVFYYVSKTPDVAYLKLRMVQNPEALAKYILSRLAEFKGLVEPLMDEFMRSILTAVASGDIVRLTPTEEEELASLGVVVTLLQWISLKHIKDILSPLAPGFSGGDLRELVNTTEWLLYCLRELAATLKLSPAVIGQIEILRRRVEHGVTEDLLELVQVPGIGRMRAMNLARYGYDSLEKIARASISALSNVPGIGEKLARRLIEYANKRL